MGKVNKLLPCPFCGGSAEIHTDIDAFEDKNFYIQCTGCGLAFNDSWGTYNTYDLDREIKRWNKRI